MATEPDDAYALQPLLYPALPVEPGVNPESPAVLGRSLRCSEPFGRFLYLGASDGRVYCFEQQQDEAAKHRVRAGGARYDDVRAASDGNAEQAMPAATPAMNAGEAQMSLRHTGTRVISGKAIERILVIPGIAVAAVLSESTVTFHALPAFTAIPNQVLPHTKGVATLALDDAELMRAADTGKSGLDVEGLASLCIVRRKVIMLVKMSVDTWRIVKEIPLPGGATGARRYGKWLCVSTTSTYNVVDLDEATMTPVGLPISQTSEAPSASSRPSIIAFERDGKPGQCDFLITSHSESLTLGAVVSQEGEPTSKLIEWPSHPRALALEYPHLHALLRNDTIEIHNVTTMERVQTIYLPPLLEPRTLSAASSKLELIEQADQNGIALTDVAIQKRCFESTPTVARSWKDDALASRTLSSQVLLTGKNAVQCLCLSQVLGAAVKSIKRGNFEQGERFLQQFSHQHASSVGTSKRTVQDLERQYVEQMLGVHCIRTLRFNEAAERMRHGQLDVRLFAAMFPSLSDGLLNDCVVTDVFAAVAHGLQQIGDLENFPNTNLEFNYSPPLDIENDPVLSALREKLVQRIRGFCKEMLGHFRHSKDQHRDDNLAAHLDTMLARLLIVERDRDSLSALLTDPSSSCDTGLIESGLESVGCFAALVRLAERSGDASKSLDLQSRLLEGAIEDPSFSGTLQDFAHTLSNCSDPGLSHRYGIWLVQRDSAAGVKILTKGKGSIQHSERATLEELRKADGKAAAAFLEAVALSRKQQDAEMHQQLFSELMRQIRTALHNDTQEAGLMKAIVDEYAAGAYAESFVAHLALRSHESVCVTSRLKLMMLLQGSSSLDMAGVLDILCQQPLLVYERAIVLGKMERDEEALELLAVGLRDANSAETYCGQARQPLSSVVVQSLEVPQLKVYVSFVQRALRRSLGSAAPAGDNGLQNSSKTSANIALLKTLLRVYMRKGESNEFQVATSHLLNTQAIHLSAQEVLETVPPDWSAHTLETFLSRSLRREMHRANEGHIQRAMALAQNLEVSQELWSQRRAMGGIIDEGSDNGHGGEGAGGTPGVAVPAEKVGHETGVALAEKADAQEKELAASSNANVTTVSPP